MIKLEGVRGARAESVLIVGGGIAGTVAAIALQQAGWRPTIVEAYDRDADGVGAFLTIAPNGVRCLQELGLERVLEPGFETPRFWMTLGSGRVVAQMSAGQSEGVSALTIRRADLYTGLRKHAESMGVHVEYGKRLVGVGTEARRPVARFEDGTQADASVIVGADGLHSVLRTVIDPDAAAPEDLGLLNTGGFATGVDLDGIDGARPGVVSFVFGRRCFFGWTMHPSGEVWWFANPGCELAPREGTSPEHWRATLIELASADRSPMRAIIEATEHIFAPWRTHDLPSVRTWRRDAMIVIGDAAHAASPSSGQGASMAIEDALVLAKCLRDLGSVQDALARYEGLRRERVERVVAQGRRNGSGKTPGPLGRWVRDAMLSVVLPLVARRDPMAWIHEHHIEWSTPVSG